MFAATGTTVVDPAGTSFEAAVLPRSKASKPRDDLDALFDADKVADGLFVRNFLPGDRIAPIGLGGSRKLTDVFIDNKLPRADRAAFPVVTLGERVVWLPGIARSNDALVTAKTKRVLRLTARHRLLANKSSC